MYNEWPRKLLERLFLAELLQHKARLLTALGKKKFIQFFFSFFIDFNKKSCDF